MEKIIYICDNCENESEIDNLTAVDDQHLCADCFFECEDCKNDFPNDQKEERDGKDLCESCAEEYYYCERCENYCASDDTYTVHVYNDRRERYDESIVCDHCYSHHYYECRCCENRCNNTTTIDNRYEVCSDCLQDGFFNCAGCNYWVEDNEYNDTDDGGYCDACYEALTPQSINGYNYKPTPVYFKTCPKESVFFGIELEVENKGSDNVKTVAEKIQSEYLYLKSDGSLNNGFEIVTHPLSFTWIRENKSKFKDLLQGLFDKGFRSYNTDTCGIHIHISKSAFNTWHLYRFLSFFKNNPLFITRLSQRKTENLERWAKLNDGSNDHDLIKKAKDKTTCADRYLAVNLNNSNTVELRIFRGTLHFPSFLKNIEFTNALYEFTKCHTSSALDEFKKFVFADPTYKHLTEFIKTKNL